MSEQFFVEQLPNGITLLGQPMEAVSSAALAILLPGGASHDPAGAEGAASVALEWFLRGAGDRDTRQLNDALDNLGCQHDENVLSEHCSFSAAQLGRNLHQVLEIYADILRRPRLEDAAFEPCRDLILQDLASLEDEPARKTGMLLREKFYPYPLGRNVYGTEQSLSSIAPQAVRDHVAATFTPAGAIFAVAGNVQWPKFVEAAKRLFSDWSGQALQPMRAIPSPIGLTHIRKESAQQHIGLAHRAVTVADHRHYAARTAETVLSGGMSSRLFTEVREKRGLVYHVSTRYHSLKEHAGFFTYAGTRPEVAQQTLDVTVGELRRLAKGVAPDEMDRARTQLKSALVMQGESTMARANAIASDWYHLRRLRSLKELSDAIDGVTAEDVLQYLADFPARDFVAMTIGPAQVDISTIGG